MTQQMKSPPPQPPPRVRRMTLSAKTSGPKRTPIKAIIYGPGGIGKTTFASHAPKAIYLPTEDGSHQLDVERLPRAESWLDLFDALEELTSVSHDRETLVVDTITGAEGLLFSHVCALNGWASIESPGYAKGEKFALDEWRRLLSALERLQSARGMHLILLGHSAVKKFSDPNPGIAGGSYDKYTLGVCSNKDSDAAALLLNWSDVMGFANFETLKSKEKSRQAISTDVRYLHTTREAAHDAKNRFGLPKKMPLDWDAFWNGVQSHEPVNPDKLRVEIEALCQWVTPAVAAAVALTVSEAGKDARELARIHNKLSAMVEIDPKENDK